MSDSALGTGAEGITDRRRVAALTILNGLLLVGIIAVPLSRSADGQAGLASRSHATYSMAGGNVPGVAMGAVYIVDETHDEMIGIMWNDKAKSLASIGYRNLAADSGASARSRP